MRYPVIADEVFTLPNATNSTLQIQPKYPSTPITVTCISIMDKTSSMTSATIRIRDGNVVRTVKSFSTLAAGIAQCTDFELVIHNSSIIEVYTGGGTLNDEIDISVFGYYDDFSLIILS